MNYLEYRLPSNADNKQVVINLIFSAVHQLNTSLLDDKKRKNEEKLAVSFSKDEYKLNAELTLIRVVGSIEALHDYLILCHQSLYDVGMLPSDIAEVPVTDATFMTYKERRFYSPKPNPKNLSRAQYLAQQNGTSIGAELDKILQQAKETLERIPYLRVRVSSLARRNKTPLRIVLASDETNRQEINSYGLKSPVPVF